MEAVDAVSAPGWDALPVALPLAGINVPLNITLNIALAARLLHSGITVPEVVVLRASWDGIVLFILRALTKEILWIRLGEEKLTLSPSLLFPSPT